MIKYLLALLLIFPAMGLADTHYVGKTNAANTGTCTNQATPCATIAYGISQMAGGDTLIVGNGTYTTTNDVIRDPPNGSAGAYTTVQAETDFGVLLDGTSWGNSSWVYGLRLDGRSYVKIQGFRINAAQNDTGGPSFIGSGSHHIKIIKCGFWNGPVDGNGEITGVGDSSGSDANYILFEDCYAFGGSRAGFTAYWSNHVIFRRCIARPDYYHFDLQTSGFCNYDSEATVYQNNIVVDMAGGSATSPSLQVYSPFFFENKSDHEPNTSIEMHGNIVINNSSYYGAVYDQVPADTRVFRDNILWGNSGGFQAGDYQNGETFYPPTYDIQRLTSGANNRPYDHWNDNFDHNATYAGGDGLAGAGTGMSIILNRTNTVTNSLFYGNQSYGAADYITSNYNAFYGNGANFGGLHTSSAGANDITTHNILYHPTTNPTGSLKYLPRGAEDGSTLATAGSSGGRVGAQVLWKIGVDGTLYGETGWDTVRSPENGYGGAEDRLWPFPNEAQIKSDMASYSGAGLSGARGFAASGTQLDGTSQITLSSYIWEYLGNQMPDDLYGDAEPPAPGNLMQPVRQTGGTGVSRISGGMTVGQ
ncbi:MAG TPA: hypothetical protein DCZ95_18175 [Verrucomicrobia bacterium]|nr:hypothetical protein [Verrucomicrobiota bacterium]